MIDFLFPVCGGNDDGEKQKKNGQTTYKKKKIIITQPLQICIGPTIRIGRDSWGLPYAGFFSQFSIFIEYI